MAMTEGAFMKYSEKVVYELYLILKSKKEIINLPLIQKCMEIEEKIFQDSLNMGDGLGKVWENPITINHYKIKVEEIKKMMEAKEDWSRLIHMQISSINQFIPQLLDASAKKSAPKRKSIQQAPSSTGPKLPTKKSTSTTKTMKSNTKTSLSTSMSQQVASIPIPEDNIPSKMHISDSINNFSLELLDANVPPTLDRGVTSASILDVDMMDMDIDETDEIFANVHSSVPGGSNMNNNNKNYSNSDNYRDGDIGDVTWGNDLVEQAKSQHRRVKEEEEQYQSLRSSQSYGQMSNSLSQSSLFMGGGGDMSQQSYGVNDDNRYEYDEEQEYGGMGTKVRNVGNVDREKEELQRQREQERLQRESMEVVSDDDDDIMAMLG